MDAKITNSNENKANTVNYSTQGFTGDPNLTLNSSLKFEIKAKQFYAASQRVL